VKRVILVNGPEPTGFGFVHLSMSSTCAAKVCCGTMNAFVRFAPRNVESTRLSLITTRLPEAVWIEEISRSAAVRPMLSMVLFFRPAVRLKTASLLVIGLPSLHTAPGRIQSVSVLPSFDQAHLLASHGYVWPGPAGVWMISDS